MKISTFAPPFHERPGFMPFILKTKISDRTSLGIWQITEPEEMFRNFICLATEDEERLSEIRYPLRRLQWLACRAIVAGLTGDRDVRITYTDKGAPILSDGSFRISLSHPGEYAAAIVSRDSRTGIDVELLRDRILRVAERFMTAEELGRTTEPCRLEKLYVHWSAKEALYKLYGGDQPDIHHGIVLEPFDYLCSGFGVVSATVFTGNTRKIHRLNWLRTGDLMLAYTLDPLNII
jgi:4'-phosphopantetheinyl transferase